MKKILTRLFLLVTWVGVVANVASADDRVPAFPGAEGFGRYTTGGRGGVIYHVTTLEDNDEYGSFRYGCTMHGPRIIVFDVCGTIYLKSKLYITRNDCTIAGQTAPGDGICIADFPFGIRADNVIIRYLRFRLGNRRVDQHEGDALCAMDHHDIIVDHCSVSWSIDECCSIYGGENLTVQWCIVSQSLVNAGHSKGAHGYGGNWGGSGATYAHNLVLHHVSRTPRLAPRPSTQLDERLDMRNNLIYNWKGEGCYGGEGMNVNIVNNYYKPGPATTGNSRTRIAKPNIRSTAYCKITAWTPEGKPAGGNAWTPMWHKWGHYYVEGNVNPACPEVTADNWGEGVAAHIDRTLNDGTATDVTIDTIRAQKPLAFPFTTTWSAADAYSKVLAYAGCCRSVADGTLRWDRVDSIMIADTRNGQATFTGDGLGPGFVNSQEDMRCVLLPDCWPMLTASPEEIERAVTDEDKNGIPDYYEQLFFGAKGIDPKARCQKRGYEQYTNMDYYLARLCDNVTRHISPECGSGEEVGNCELLGKERGRYVYGEQAEGTMNIGQENK